MGLDGESSPGLGGGGGRPLGALGAFLHAPHTPPYLGSTPPPAPGSLASLHHSHPHNPHFPYEGMGAFTALGKLKGGEARINKDGGDLFNYFLV